MSSQPMMVVTSTPGPSPYDNIPGQYHYEKNYFYYYFQTTEKSCMCALPTSSKFTHTHTHTHTQHSIHNGTFTVFPGFNNVLSHTWECLKCAIWYSINTKDFADIYRIYVDIICLHSTIGK